MSKLKLLSQHPISLAGLLLFLAGATLLMGIITGEIFYPAEYRTAQNDISDLGATLPPNSIIYPVPATIFNSSMGISGVLIIASSILLSRAKTRRLVTIPMFLLGVSVLGVGLFPGNKMPVHALFSMATFIVGGLTAILSFKATSAPFRYSAVFLGTITLTFLVLAIFFNENTFAVLGSGGTERWVAYPVIIWLMGLGGYFMGKE